MDISTLKYPSCLSCELALEKRTLYEEWKGTIICSLHTEHVSILPDDFRYTIQNKTKKVEKNVFVAVQQIKMYLNFIIQNVA